VTSVVGPTGAGKSWFTKELVNNENVHVGKKGQHPCTKDVQAWRCNFDQGPDNIVIVDTPSFHTEVEGFDAERIMGNWVKSRLAKNCRRSGVLFLHTLARDPTHRDVSMHLHLATFRTIFPPGYPVPSNVYVVPTMDKACKLSDDKVTERLSQLRDQTTSLDPYWHASMVDEVFRGRAETGPLEVCRPSEVAWEVLQRMLQDVDASEQ
ncbi:hypothetical protein ID866_7215, partial [Astraeus odoratus]